MKTFHDKTFVAFIDIPEFKKIMKIDKKKAHQALDTFYQAGYDELKKKTTLSGVFVSVYGVLYAHDGNDTEKLQDLLEVIRKINEKMLEEEIILTTSIAFGQFDFDQSDEEKSQPENISNNPIYGQAYLDAYFSNKNVDPGCCLLLSKRLKESTVKKLGAQLPIKKKGTDYLYYWNLQDEGEIESFEEEFQDAKYKAILGIFKKYSTIHSQ
jgi:hypothetical protein